MRIAITSNLHLHITGKEPLRRMVAGMNRYNPDAVVLAGNIASGLVPFEECLNIFLRVNCPVVIVPGRADLYAHAGVDSLSLYEDGLPDLVREFGFHWLEGPEPFVLGNVAIAGAMVRCSEPTWDDPEPISESFLQSDAREKTLRHLARQIDVIARDEDIAKALVVTHETLVDNIDDLLVPGIPPMPSEGCDDLLRSVIDCGKIRWVVSGAPEEETSSALEREGLPPLALATIGSAPFSPRYTFIDTSEG